MLLFPVSGFSPETRFPLLFYPIELIFLSLTARLTRYRSKRYSVNIIFKIYAEKSRSA